MTREEAIKIIKDCKEKKFKHTFYTVNEYDAALDMAIKALRREDTYERKKVVAEALEILDIGTEDFVRYMKFMRAQIKALEGGEQE